MPREFVLGASSSVLEWLLLPGLHEIAGLLGNATLRVEAHRTLPLIDGVREGRLDFVIVREDAVPVSLPSATVARKVDFLLCVPGALVRRHGPACLTQPRGWAALPLAAPTTGGQFHEALKRAFATHEMKLRPAVQCHSFLHVRQLVETGHYAGVLPSWGIAGLEERGVVLRPFAPPKNYGRPLCLHWNLRQMARRGVDQREVDAIAATLSQFSRRPLKSAK